MWRWIVKRGFHVTMTVAFAVFAYHLYGELALLQGAPPTLIQRLERTALDAKLGSRGPNPPERWGVAIAAIDEKAIKKLGRFPWSRITQARLTDRLTELGAKVIAFDVTFAYPSRDATNDAIESFRTTAVASGLYDARAGLTESIAEADEVLSRRDDAVARVLDRARENMVGATEAIGKLSTALQDESKNRDADAVFADAIERSKRVVLGVVSYAKAEADALGAAPLAESLSRVSGSTIAEYVVMDATSPPSLPTPGSTSSGGFTAGSSGSRRRRSA